MAIRVSVLYMVLKQAYTCRYTERKWIDPKYTSLGCLVQISTPVESPMLIFGALSADLAFDAEFSAVALLLLYFSWALSSSGDQWVPINQSQNEP